MTNAEEITTAQAPFDDHNCDIILRSSNGVDFHVFKLILSLVSPVFKKMFTLPQPDVSSVPVIPLTEGSTTLESLLLLCYPATTPTFNSLDDAKAVMEAARKYDMQAALDCAGDLTIVQFLPDHCLELYALSCRFGWQHHAQTAAFRALEIKDLGRPSNGFNGMKDITADDYHRLLVYHYKCGDAVQKVGTSLSWLQLSSGEVGIASFRTREIGRMVMKNVPWFDEYLVLSGKELSARPCESTLLESKSYDNAIINATKCVDCRSTVVDDMHRFRALYIAQVKKVLAAEKLAVS
ncbi:hypothetical protein DEU56DRAFT_574907 [Suillus clintonianus]|uniref:uncharacterized protein n=1 Tax=Suillus clintonianus TaxID=1904413 RepID=UPI001B870772|nr:uncharacterized protein DEU56DRAFT_574907 [Suillus clintonianus]KAG2125313.1 hypothetical protein DEU56DRAFT_574907 [Suillus clintonianus]